MWLVNVFKKMPLPFFFLLFAFLFLSLILMLLPNHKEKISNVNSNKNEAFTDFTVEDEGFLAGKNDASAHPNPNVHNDNRKRAVTDNDPSYSSTNNFVSGRQLWQMNSVSKQNYQNNTDNLNIDEKYFMDFDSTGIKELRAGDRLTLESKDGEKTQVVLAYGRTSQDYSNNNGQNSANLYADYKKPGYQKSWVLVSESGENIGQLEVSEHFINGQYRADNGHQFIFRAKDGVGWHIPKKELQEVIKREAEPDPSLASVDEPSHPDYGWPETSFNPNKSNDPVISPEYTYDGSDI